MLGEQLLEPNVILQLKPRVPYTSAWSINIYISIIVNFSKLEEHRPISSI